MLLYLYYLRGKVAITIHHVSRTPCLLSSVVCSRPLIIYLVPTIITKLLHSDVICARQMVWLCIHKPCVEDIKKKSIKYVRSLFAAT